MPKRKKPSKDSRSEHVVEPQAQEQSDPVAPSLPSSSALELRPPALSRFIEAVRKAVNAALDLADAAADAVTKAVRKGA